MITTLITNDHFHTRVNALISDYLSGSSVPTIPPLNNLDTDLEPGESASSLLAFTSPWIDICSPDPLIAGISKQILYMEVAYAAFCGIDFLFIQGPKLHHKDSNTGRHLVTNNVVEYARAIQESLGLGNRLQISIFFPMSERPAKDDEDTTILKTREEFLDEIDEEKPEKSDGLGIWDAWNVIRTVCKYHSRLYVGKIQCNPFIPFRAPF